jgi:Ca2+-transporting ATPase
MLQTTKEEKTPLTKQIDDLTLVIAGLAGAALILIVITGLAQGESFDELFAVGVALAVAAIPTGMPVVLTTVLAIGTTELAKLGALVKKLPSVETLGSTSAICSDKTGTLTLNQMTARELTVGKYRFTITGEGYSFNGQILHAGRMREIDLDPVLLPMALCSDAVVKDGELVGDPTEGALVVLAAKGGLDVVGTRREMPRIAEVPFDSAYKFMATFHNMTDRSGEAVVRCFVKGAPDVLIARAANGRTPDGDLLDMDDSLTQLALQENDRLANEGMRVMVVASRDFDPKTFDPTQADLLPLITDLTLLGMAGIVDPPRPEAREAIGECKSAGIRVRMITGDHVATASAIGHELGISGRAITGAEFAQMRDQQLEREVDEIGVIARVAPEDKVRLVQVLQNKENIVAMTGDGVNDAPALKAANIGVAMGITGTEVSKDAADMILTDDNFATIVTAVEQGRSIYDNLMKYIRFQMAVLVGFILAFVGSSLFGIAGAALFTTLQILWVNFIIDAPVGSMLGFDTPTAGLMKHKPRPANAKILNGRLATRLTLVGIVMAVVTLVIYSWAATTFGSEVVAQTMALTMFSLSHIFVALNLRHPRETVFRMETLSNSRLLLAIGFAVIAAILVTELPLLQRIFETTNLTPQQWLVCWGGAVLILVLAEISKFIANRFIFPRRSDQATA